MRLYTESEEETEQREAQKTDFPHELMTTITTDNIPCTDECDTALDDKETQEMPQMIPDEEVMGAIECAALCITVLNGIRFVIVPTGMASGPAMALAEKAGELLNQHLHSPESIINVTKNTQAV